MRILKKVMGVFICFMAALLCSCGGSSGSGGSPTSTYPVTIGVTTPTQSNLAVPLGAANGKTLLTKAITDTPAVGAAVQARDVNGNIIDECTTGAEATCSVNLTQAQLEAGYVITSSDMHSYQKPDSTEIAAAVAGTTLTASVDPEENMIYALVATNCEGDIALCPATIDTGCLRDAVGVLPGDDEPGTDTVDGYVEALLEAQRTALVNNPAGATSGLITALEGDSTAFVADVGAATVSDVPVADAVTNSQVGASSVNTAYCTKASATADSPWKTARAAAPTTDKATFDMAMAGMFEYFAPSELQTGTYTPASFQAFMTNGPQLTDFFTTVGGSDNDLARSSFVQGFKNGMFAEPANAPVAVGLIGAAFPAKVDGVIPWTANAFDPATAVLAGRNAFVEMTNASSFNPASFTPNGVHSAFNGALSDPAKRTTFASGGVTEYVTAYMGSPTTFVPADNYTKILAPPGSACTTNAGCLPCDNCVNGYCVAGSDLMGKDCPNGNECNDGITICVGSPNSTFASSAAKKCNCAAAGALPTGAGVFDSGGAAPQPYNPAGGAGTYQLPTVGVQGSPCEKVSEGPSTYYRCTTGTCTNSEQGGMCVASDYRYPAGSSCDENHLCTAGNTCTDSRCTPPTESQDTSKRADGDTCTFARDCKSSNCVGNICQPFPSGGSTELKANDVACAASAECRSGFCDTATLKCASKKADGVTCMTSAECASTFCNTTTFKCGQSGGGGGAGAHCTSNSACGSGYCDMGVQQCGPPPT